MNPITAEAVYVHPAFFTEGKNICVQLAIMVDRGQGECIESLLVRCSTKSEAEATYAQINEKIRQFGKCMIFTPSGIPEYRRAKKSI